jgi:hypothetical protein
MTWDDLFLLSLRNSGVYGTGQSMSAVDEENIRQITNMMLGQWQVKRWLVYHLVSLSTTCDGSTFYTIGDGGTFDVPRPEQIDFAFARQVTQSAPNQPDFPLRIIRSYEEYSQIGLKELSASPSWGIFYDSGYPLGKLYPYPIMNDQYELHVGVKARLDEAGAGTDVIVMPPEYQYALYYNLMLEARVAYRLKPDPQINARAKAALNTLRAANTQIGTMNMPVAVRAVGGGGYNAYSDSIGPTFSR